jgi:hypothetical protein
MLRERVYYPQVDSQPATPSCLILRCQRQQQFFITAQSYRSSDPQHVILQHLRNRVEMLSYYSRAIKDCTQWYKAFTETYGCRATLLHCVIFALEANLFRIPELQAALYEKNFRFMSVFSGGKNLFDMAPWLAY